MAQTVQRSFTAGEVSPAVRARADLAKYASGLALCENFFVRPQGGVYSRAGTRFVCELDDSTQRGRLIPFQFNTDQTYVLVFEDNKMRVIKDAGLVLTDALDIYELVTPYGSEDLARLQFTQSADVMTITHPDHPPQDLGRLADNDWFINPIDFSPQVETPTWSGDLTASISDIQVSAGPDFTVEVTTSSPHGYSTNDRVTITGVVGMTEVNGLTFVITITSATKFTLDDINGDGYTAYVSGGTAGRGFVSPTGSGFGGFSKSYGYVVTTVDQEGVESLPSVEAGLTVKSLSTTGGVRLNWDPVAGAAYYRIYKDPSRFTGIYGWIGDAKTSQFVDFNIAPITSDAPPADRNPFVGAGSYPSSVAYYQQRKIFANTGGEPQTVFASQTGVYNSMRSSSPARDGDAITFTINSKQVNQIRHLIELDSLVIFTSGGEYRVTEGQNEVLTPSTAGVRKQSNNGASWVAPVVINDTIIYVQEKGGRIRDIDYEFVDNKYKGNDRSILAEHLFENRSVEEMAYAAEPYGVLWVVMDDGQLLGFTYQKDHEVWAWHRHSTATNDGLSQFESVASISEDGRDAVYFIVKRVVDGVTVRYVERMEKRVTDAPENVWCLDSALRYEGEPVTVLSGLDHLEGEAVAAVADGYVVDDLVVTGGSVTLPRAASKITVGLKFVAAIEMLDIDIATQGETLKGKSISISKVMIEFENSRGAWVGPKRDDGSTGLMNEIKPRRVEDGYGVLPLTTRKEEVTIEPGWSLGGGIRIEQRVPMPSAILSVIPEVDVS